MRRGVSQRFASRVALAALLVGVPQLLSATAPVSKRASHAPVGESAVIQSADGLPTNNLAEVLLAGDWSRGSAPAPRAGNGQALSAPGSILDEPAQLILIVGVALIVLFALANSRAACAIVGHHRSRRRIRFDEQDHQWVSTCKRCRARLYRDPFGDWLVASVPRPKAIVLERVAEPKYDIDDAVPAALPLPDRTERRPVLHHADPSSDEPHLVNGPAYAAGAHMMVGQLLDDVLGGHVAPPGARGALFFVVDELRAAGGMDPQARLAEKISIEFQHLQSALQRGADDEATVARNELSLLAGEWSKS